MKNALAFVILATVFLAASQPMAEDFRLVEMMIRNIQPEGKIVYTNKLIPERIDFACKVLGQDVIAGPDGAAGRNSIILSKTEKKLLIQALRDNLNLNLNDNLFRGSKMVKSEYLPGYFRKYYQDFSEKLTDPYIDHKAQANIMKMYKRPIVFAFTMPVYIRNKSICVSYISYRCGNSCGYDELSFYKKTNDEWTKYIVAYSRNF